MPSGSLLPSVLKPYGRKVFANRIDSFFNAEGMVWQSWGLFSKLCYLMKQDVETYCYVAFQPFTKRDWVTRATPDLLMKTKAKLGFVHVRPQQVSSDVLAYLAKKPLDFTVHGSGLWYFPAPSTIQWIRFSWQGRRGGRKEQSPQYRLRHNL
jgi:hypothetical protein